MRQSHLFELTEGLRGSVLIVVVVALFLGLLTITGYNFFYRSKKYSTQLLVSDIQRLVDIFQKIDTTCKILDFDYQKNNINFLNVDSFEGSEVGPLNLTYPAQWRGPYVEDNPTLQGIEYQVIRTKKGYFITPGQGVRLPNGKIIGKDIILDEDADVPAMMHDEDALMYDGKALAAPLQLSGSVVQQEFLEHVRRHEGDELS